MIKFQLMAFIFDDCTLYHQIKVLNGFLCNWRLNSKSLIQPLEILPFVDLCDCELLTFFVKYKLYRLKSFFQPFTVT